MGRSLVFLARIVQDGWSSNPREIAVDEKNAVLLESDGQARVIGPGKGAYFIEVKTRPSECRPGATLSFADIRVYHEGGGGHFDLRSWSGMGGRSYTLSVEKGAVMSSQPGGDLY